MKHMTSMKDDILSWDNFIETLLEEYFLNIIWYAKKLEFM